MRNEMCSCSLQNCWWVLHLKQFPFDLSEPFNLLIRSVKWHQIPSRFVDRKLIPNFGNTLVCWIAKLWHELCSLRRLIFLHKSDLSINVQKTDAFLSRLMQTLGLHKLSKNFYCWGRIQYNTQLLLTTCNILTLFKQSRRKMKTRSASHEWFANKISVLQLLFQQDPACILDSANAAIRISRGIVSDCIVLMEFASSCCNFLNLIQNTTRPCIAVDINSNSPPCYIHDKFLFFD